MMSNFEYAEVRNNYLDESDNFYRIDAWESDDDNEEGVVAAYVHAGSGDAVICEPKAHLSQKVKAAIKELQDKIRKSKDVPENYCCVHMAVEGRFDAFVPQGTVEEMKTAAEQEWSGADFGELHEADMEIVYIQDSKGNYIYEK